MSDTVRNDDPLLRMQTLLSTQFIHGEGLTDLQAVVIEAGIREIERLRKALTESTTHHDILHPTCNAELARAGVGDHEPETRIPRSTRYCDYDLCPETFDLAHSNASHEPSVKPAVEIFYGTLTCRDPSDVTRTLWTRTSNWVEASDFTQRTTGDANGP